MSFWDFIRDPGNLFTSDNERVAGTPRPARRRLGRVPSRPRDIWGSFADAAGSFKERYDAGNNMHMHGVWNNPNRGSGLVGRPFGLQEYEDQGGGVEDILAQLEAMQDPSRYMGDRGSLAAQAMAMAAQQYDPQIAELQKAMESANARGHRNKDELGRMFSALSSDLQGDVPEIQQMYAQDKQESKAGYDQLQQQIKEQYANSAAEQEDMLKRLNIQAAAPDILPEQQRDRDYFTELAAHDAATEQSALGTEERGAVNFTTQGSQIARSEGTQRQADLMAQLSDLLNQYEGQIGAQKSAKQQAYLSNLLGLEQDQQQSAVAAAQRDFENYIKMIQVGRDLRSDGAKTGVTTVKSPADVAARALGMGLPQRNAQAIQDVFMSTISSDPQILGGMGMFGQSLPKEALAQRVVEAGKQAGLNSQELNVLQTVALEYFGRR